MRAAIALLLSIVMLCDSVAVAAYTIGTSSDDGRFLTPICRDGKLVFVYLDLSEDSEDEPQEELSFDCPLLVVATRPSVPASQAIANASVARFAYSVSIRKTDRLRPPSQAPPVRGPPASV